MTLQQLRFLHVPSRIISGSTSLKKKLNEETGLHKIENNSTNPMMLFQKWFKEYQETSPYSTGPMSRVCCFSTADRKGKVSSRSLIMRRLDDDGFVIMTDNRSYKVNNLEQNPYGSMVFLWNGLYDGVLHTRQVRVGGPVKKLSDNTVCDLYRDEPLFAKIRAHICNQGEPVEWIKLKKQHDQFLEGDKYLSKPGHVVCYKLTTEFMEFYETYGNQIGDRLLYTTKNFTDWKVQRIAA